jgi:hypothetical protein
MITFTKKFNRKKCVDSVKLIHSPDRKNTLSLLLKILLSTIHTLYIRDYRNQ